MSYILDALKKAESERSLGSIPNVHAQPVSTTPLEDSPSHWSRRPLMWIALAALLILFAAFAWFKPWQATPALIATAPLPEQTRGKALENPPLTPVQSPPVNSPIVVTPSAQQVPVVAATPPIPIAPQPAPVVIAAAPAANVTPAITATRQLKALPAEPVTAKGGSKLVNKSAQSKLSQSVVPSEPPLLNKTEPIPAATVPSSENRILTLNELPEKIQREIPLLAVGGYIYSGNQADRQLLINKNLRREGEEVAPGLTLEKMMPKAAILNYKGYRYRISY